MKKSKLLLSFAIALCSVGVLSSGGMEVKKVEAEAANGTYKLVTDVSNLAVGDKVIIASVDSSKWVAMSTTQNSKNRGQAAITVTADNKVTLTSTDKVEQFTLSTGNVSGTFAFYTGENYLYAASSSNNHLKSQATLDNNGSWKITIANTGVATVEAQGKYTHNLMQYNATSSLFSCYTSEQNDIYIFELESGSAVLEYTVSFETNGGTTIDDCKVAEGSKVSRPTPNPEKEGYKFGGWYSDSSCTTEFDFESAINEDTTLYAKWIEKSIGELFADNTNVEGALSFGFDLLGKSRSDVISINNLDMDGQKNSYDSIRISTIKGTTTKLSSSFYINSEKIQTNKNNGCYIKNTTAFADEIKAVRVNWNQSPTKLNIYGAINSEASVENKDCFVQTSAEKNARVNISTKGIKYLYIDLNTNVTGACTISSIDIIYDEPSITNFSDMSLNFKTNYDFTSKTQGIDFTEAGMMFIIGSDVSATYSKTTAEALPGDAKTATQTDYSKEFIVRLEDIPVSDWKTKVTVVPYILVDGTYYFGTAGVTTVLNVATEYVSSTATITLSDESVVTVREVALAIAVYSEANKQ